FGRDERKIRRGTVRRQPGLAGLPTDVTQARRPSNQRDFWARAPKARMPGFVARSAKHFARIGLSKLGLAGLLGPIERVVGALEERIRVVPLLELGDAAGHRQALDTCDRLGRHGLLDAGVELPGLWIPRLRQDDCELDTADATCDVRRAQGAAHAYRRFREHGVSCQVPDPFV